MSIDSSVNALLDGGGSSARFETIGDLVKGTIISATTSQQTDFVTREPKTWKNGDPMMQVVIRLQTDERDPDNATDTGERSLYVDSRGKREALKEALRRANAKLEVGGMLAMQYTGDGEAERGMNPPKQYRAEYAAPAPATGVDSAVANLL